MLLANMIAVVTGNAYGIGRASAALVVDGGRTTITQGCYED